MLETWTPRLRGDEQGIGYLAVAAAVGDQPQHVPFARGQAEGLGGGGAGGCGRLGGAAPAGGCPGRGGRYQARQGDTGPLGEEFEFSGERAGAQRHGGGVCLAEQEDGGLTRGAAVQSGGGPLAAVEE